MADKVIITKSKLDNLARAVSNKSGAALDLTIDQMVAAVNSIVVDGGGSIVPTGTIQITSNGTVDVTNYASAEVNVPTGSTINNQNKSVTPTESEQSITADSGYTGLGTVTVGAISSTYVGSGITQRSSSDLTASGATITAPAGYYESAGNYTMPEGDFSGFPTVKANEDLTYITVVQKIATAGYMPVKSSGTYTKTITNLLPYQGETIITPNESQQTAVNEKTWLTGAVIVNAIPSTYIGSGITRRDSDDLTASGATVSVPAGYYSAAASKSVASGSATAPASISGTAASVSTGTNTLTLTKTVSVTPTVNAGYVSAGTAGNSSVSLTASVTTKAAATITPTTANQTIAAGTYLTGTQTIAGDADLVGGNILSTANIFGVQGTVVVQNYYTGSSAPSSSTGSNGDLYLQS